MNAGSVLEPTRKPLTLFGALIGVVGLVAAVYNFWAATTTNRPDIYDVTTDKEEPDPFNRRRSA
jgi:hypothetical protein